MVWEGETAMEGSIKLADYDPQGKKLNFESRVP